MNETDTVFYNLMAVGIPILLSVLAFIGVIAVNALVKMGNDIGSIKITLGEFAIKHDGLEEKHKETKENHEKRLDKIEHKIFNCE